MDDFSHKEINRLSISRQDFEQCRRFLKQLPNHEYASTLYEALLLSAIVCYARPFSGNEKDKGAKADSRIKDEVLVGLSHEELELHKSILTLRNKAVAHAEWSQHPTGVSENGVISSVPFSIWKHFHGEGHIERFTQLVSKVLLKAHHLTGDILRTRP